MHEVTFSAVIENVKGVKVGVMDMYNISFVQQRVTPPVARRGQVSATDSWSKF